MTTKVDIKLTGNHNPVRITPHCNQMPLTQEQLHALLFGFLGQLSADMGNAGCNDWDFPKDWSQPERDAFARAVWYNTDPSNRNNTVAPPDFAVVDFLQKYFSPSLSYMVKELKQVGDTFEGYVHSTTRYTVEELTPK